MEFLELKQITEVEDVKAHHIRDFMKQKQDSGNTACYVNDILKACKTWFNYLVEEDYAVKEKLKSPSTAQFCTTTEATIGRNGNTWTVKGWVDAQNGYGATVRANFVVTFTFASKDTYSVALCTVS